MAHQISGFLIDIDGVLLTGNQSIPGAIEAIQFLLDKQIPYLLTTNTTRQSRITIWHHLKRIGFPIKEIDIITAPIAAAHWLKKKGVYRINLMVSGSTLHDFKDFKITSHQPKYVIIGDIGKDLTFERLNNTFRLIMGGAKILALQKNRYWQTIDGLTIDAGGVVAAIEYATKKRAKVIGKPNKEFFYQAAQLINLPPEELAVVGDDLESDIDGGKKAGMFTIMVKTGKFRKEIFKKSKIKPDIIFESIADLPNFISKTKEN